MKEIAFKAIDLKAEYARMLASQGESPSVIAGDLTAWLRSVKPRSYVFVAARVISDKDRDRVVQFANVASLVSDAVGVFCFGPGDVSRPTSGYVPREVPAHIQLDRVLFRACQDLTNLKNSPPLAVKSPSPAAIADALPPE